MFPNWIQMLLSSIPMVCLNSVPSLCEGSGNDRTLRRAWEYLVSNRAPGNVEGSGMDTVMAPSVEFSQGFHRVSINYQRVSQGFYIWVNNSDLTATSMMVSRGNYPDIAQCFRWEQPGKSISSLIFPAINLKLVRGCSIAVFDYIRA